MAYKVTVQCPDCAGRFSVILEATDPMPDFCNLCGAYVGPDDPNFVPARMNIGTPLGKSGDQTFRMMEQHSIARAEATGDPNLKITDLNDNLREGDVAAKAPNNIVSQYAAEMKRESGFDYFQGVSGVRGYTAGATEGGSGASVLQGIQEVSGTRSSPTPMSRNAGSWGGR